MVLVVAVGAVERRRRPKPAQVGWVARLSRAMTGEMCPAIGSRTEAHAARHASDPEIAMLHVNCSGERLGAA
jgi:hypothetical protein